MWEMASRLRKRSVKFEICPPTPYGVGSPIGLAQHYALAGFAWALFKRSANRDFKREALFAWM